MSPDPNEAPERIRESIRKVKALADGGFEGERAAAQRKLDDLLKKYNVTLEEVSGDHEAWRTFTFRTGWERQLLIQIVAMLLDTHRVQCEKEKGIIRFKLTIATRTDVFEAFSHYQPMLAAQFERNRLASLDVRRAFKRSIENLQDQRKILDTAFYNHFNIRPRSEPPKPRFLDEDKADAARKARQHFEGDEWQSKHGKLGDQLALGNGDDQFKLEN